jgi:hypothetical protein
LNQVILELVWREHVQRKVPASALVFIRLAHSINSSVKTGSNMSCSRPRSAGQGHLALGRPVPSSQLSVRSTNYA